MLQRYFFYFLLLLSPLPAFSQNSSIEFIKNEGQWDAPFSYKAVTGKGDVFLSSNAFTYLIGNPANGGRMDAVHHGLVNGPAKLDFHAYRMSFIGAATPEIVSSKHQSWYYNYFIGKDPSRWHSNIHPALALDYTGIYPGINLHVASEAGNLKYEWIVQANTDPSAIQMRIDGADGLNIKGGNLIINTSIGEVQELKPVAYQYTADGRKEVVCRYRLKGNVLTYDLPNDWDRNSSLIIDPTVVFCTFTGSSADNWGYTATYDDSGNFYAGGIMLNYNGSGGGSFPTTLGAFQTSFAGGFTDPNAQISDAHGIGYACDMAIMKLNPAGSTRIWATYIGGALDNDQPHSLIVDNNHNLIIAGNSYSSDFPVTPGCYDNTANGSADIVVVKLNPSGSALVGSTFIGGSSADGVNYSGSENIFGNLKHNYGDNARSEVIIDKNNNIYVTASTKSANFPTTSTAYQNSLSGVQDAVILKLNPSLTSLTYSTYLGGSNDDAGYVLALDTGQTHLYVGGGTMSSNFPGTGAGSTWHSSYQGGAADGFIARFGNGGTYPLQRVCFVGTSNEDQVYGVQVDAENSVYSMGQSLGGAFPVTAGVYSNPSSSQFIIKMDSLLLTNKFSTVYGSGDPLHTNISPVAFLVDTCQNIYISGWGGNLGFTTGVSTIGSTTGMPTTPSTINSPLSATTDGSDFYFIVLSKNAINLLYGAFLGRYSTNANFGEHVDGGTSRFDKSGVIYQGICANCGGTAGGAFPTTTGSWATTNGSVNCNEAALKIAFQLGAVDAQAAATPNAKGCPPLTVHFGNMSTNAVTYQWNYADGSPTDTAQTPNHTFQNAGIYQVRLIAFNPNACRVLDTAYVTITVDSNKVKSAFTVSIVDSCGPYRASFANTSQYGNVPGAAGFTQFTWLFGDGTSFTGTTPPIHTYPGTGTYTVTLIMRDTTACNNPDTSKHIITLNGSLVKAGFSVPTVCAGKPTSFTNTSTNALTYQWKFGDGGTSAVTSPMHTYATPGTYTATLISNNPGTCNKIDSTKQTVTVSSLPTAAFTFTPVIPIANTPIQFNNASTNATGYVWIFGDGSPNSNEVNPSHFYRRTGHYTVCLVAKGAGGCDDTLCKGADADIRTAADLPTAFSPNGDGSNDVLYVRGGAIDRMNLKIFNRWGELVFESSDINIGWDGTYKNKPQEMDAYAFVLDVTFVDGTTFLKKGNITLLR